MLIDIQEEPISLASCGWPDPLCTVTEYFEFEAEEEDEGEETKGGQNKKQPVKHHRFKVSSLR